jgi:hypothetical protein
MISGLLHIAMPEAVNNHHQGNGFKWFSSLIGLYQIIKFRISNH